MYTSKKWIMSLFILLSGLFSIDLRAEEIDTFYIDSNENFYTVIESLKVYLDHQNALNGFQEEPVEALNLDVFLVKGGIKVKPYVRKATVTRNYTRPTSSKEKEKIRYIVKTLAYASPTKLLSESSDLKKKGKEIDHLHPLRFLMAIFTDEEMKAGVHAIRDRYIPWIWDGFLDGVRRTMKEEADKDNLKIEYIEDFARKVKLDVQLILPIIQHAKWDNLVDILIDHIPRDKNHDRYDM